MDNKDDISGEEAVPDVNQTSALDNTPIDYDDYADEIPLLLAGSLEDLEDQFLQKARGELRQRALEKVAIALDYLFYERYIYSIYNIP